MRRRFWAVLVAALLVVTLVAAIYGNRHERPPVGAVLYLWYGGPNQDSGLGTPGWNSSTYPGGGTIVDQPTIGYYSSDDNETFAWQVSQMQKAGFSFAVISWWGPSTLGESGAINKATHDFFAYLKSNGSTFKAAIMIDAYNGTHGLSNPSLASDYDYIYNNFVTPFGKWYFDWPGPLLMTFNPVTPLDNDSRFTSKEIGNYACEPIDTCAAHSLNQKLDWIFWDTPAQYFVGQGGSYNATNDEGPPVISSDGEVTLVPRIDSYYDQGYQNGSFLRFDPSLSKGLYQEQWGYVLSHSSSVKLVIIYSWNEYHERTAIEPHIDFTANINSTYLSNLTSYYASKL
ncbi:MAG: hypothetical protein KGI38_10050 [Thaumarchaeota archaeon]|nr:hypothetical protein [Nitrososphaerota archaeon]